MSALRKSLAIRLLVISNLFVAAAAASQGLALFLPAIIAYIIAFSLALIGAGVAIWQGSQADNEQKQFIESYVKLQDEMRQAKEWEQRKFMFLLSVGVIAGLTIHYWLHPEKRPKP